MQVPGCKDLNLATKTTVNGFQVIGPCSLVSLSVAVNRAVENEEDFIKDLESLLLLLSHHGLKQNVPSFENFIQNIRNILKVHRNLRDQLTASSSIVSAFFNFVPHLTVYLDYCCYLKRMKTFVEEILHQHDSKTWMKSLELLQAPLYHIARYEVILTDLCKVLTEQEGKALNGICDSLQTVVNEMQSICSSTENALKLLWIQKCLVGGQPKLFKPGRVLLKEGCLMKVTCNGRTSKVRVLLLFNDILLICKRKGDHTEPYKKSSLHCTAVIPLQNCFVRSHLVSKAGNEALFKISWENHTYLLFSETVGLSQMWMKELQQAIRQYKESVSIMNGKSEIKTPCLKRAPVIVRKPMYFNDSSESKNALCQLSPSGNSRTLLYGNHKTVLSFKKFKQLLRLKPM